MEKRLWRVEHGTLAGRLPVRGLLGAAGTVPTPGTNGTQHLCSNPLFAELKKTVCEELDIARTDRFDFSAGRKCDALSMAIAFSADPAKWSGLFYTESEFGNECSPGPDDRPVDAGADVVYRCE